MGAKGFLAKFRFAVFVFLILAFVNGTSSWAADFYDEMYLVPPQDGKKGVPRPQYKRFLEEFDKLTEDDRKKFIEESKRALDGEYAISPMIKLLTQSEHNLIQRGTEQRALALQAFLKDYYSNGSKWKKVVPPDVLKRIIQRSNSDGLKKYVDPNRIYFPYAVDLVRDEYGQFRPLEDNPGYYGGPGDIQLYRNFLKEKYPHLYSAAGFLDDPKEFAIKWISNIRKQLGPDGKIVFFTQNMMTSDNEDKRMEEIVKELGVEVIDPYTQHGWQNGNEIFADKDGVYIRRKGEKKKVKVDYIMMNLEPDDWDLSPKAYKRAYMLMEALWYINDEDPAKSNHISEKKKAVLREAIARNKEGRISWKKIYKAIKGLGLESFLDDFPEGDVKGLMKAIRRNKVQSTYTSGVDFIGDKEFYPYVPEIIRTYLGEEPIFKNVETHSLAVRDKNGKWVLDEKAFKKDKANKEKAVLKMVDGRGGEGIYVGPQISKEEWESGFEEAKKEFERFQVQEVIKLSRQGGYITDLRAMGHVGPWGFLGSPTEWARFVPAEGSNGKVNVSDAGLAGIVGVVPDPVPVKVPEDVSREQLYESDGRVHKSYRTMGLEHYRNKKSACNRIFTSASRKD